MAQQLKARLTPKGMNRTIKKQSEEEPEGQNDQERRQDKEGWARRLSQGHFNNLK